MCKQNVIKRANENGHSVDTFSKKQIFIPVIRSPHNHAASCLKWRGNKHFINQPENFTLLWKSYAKEYLGITHCIPNISVPINYDLWFSNKEYRKSSFDKMGIDVAYSDRNLNKVLRFGKGSSFDGRFKDNKAQEMKILDRWRFFINDKVVNSHYIKMLNDPELIELSEKIFGELPFKIEDYVEK